MADALQAFWQHVDEEAADELVGDERYALATIADLDPLILQFEGDVPRHDPEKCVAVFRKDHALSKDLKRDDDPT